MPSRPSAIRRASSLIAFAGAALYAAAAWATPQKSPEQPPAARAQVTVVVGGLDHPWSMAFLPEGGVLITERPGNLRLLRTPGGLSKPLAGVPRVAAPAARGDCSTSPCRRGSPRTGWST